MDNIEKYQPFTEDGRYGWDSYALQTKSDLWTATDVVDNWHEILDLWGCLREANGERVHWEVDRSESDDLEDPRDPSLERVVDLLNTFR